MTAAIFGEAVSSVPTIQSQGIGRRGTRDKLNVDFSYLNQGQNGAHILEHEDIRRDHEWHFRFNRRLANFSTTLTSMAFSPDGAWLFCGVGSGDLKVWSTKHWGESATLQGARMEEFKSVTISPAQSWLVCVQPSSLYVFRCGAPWALEQTLPAMTEPRRGEPLINGWRGALFSPCPEVDQVRGKTGQDNFLACINRTHLIMMSYGRGWGEGLTQRTHSLLAGTTPTAIAYSNCGSRILTAYESGEIQIWNAASLAMEKVVKAHVGAVTCLIALPENKDYDGVRMITAGADARLKVWKREPSWMEESSARDRSCDGGGVRSVTASSDGMWVMSMAADLFIWRVCVSQHGLVTFRLHQRLQAVSSAEVLLCSALSPNCDALSVGTRDGVLGVFRRHSGASPCQEVRMDDNTADAENDRDHLQGGRNASTSSRTKLRPMRRVRTESFGATLADLKDGDPLTPGPGGESTPAGRRLSATLDPRELSLAFAQAALAVPKGPMALARTIGSTSERSASVPHRRHSSAEDRWTAKGFDFESVVRPFVRASAQAAGSPAATSRVFKAERSMERTRSQPHQAERSMERTRSQPQARRIGPAALARVGSADPH